MISFYLTNGIYGKNMRNVTATYLSLKHIELALIVAGVGGRIKHASKLKVLNYKKAMQSPDSEECHKEIMNEKESFDKYNALILVHQSLHPRVPRFSPLCGQ